MKLDRTGEYVICDEPRGAGRCGGRIAFVNAEKGRRVILALPGWERGEDGIFHEPPNDFARRQLGHPARPLPRKVTGTHRSGQSWLAPMLFRPLPFRCSDCQTIHHIKPGLFGLASSEGSVITEKRLP